MQRKSSFSGFRTLALTAIPVGILALMPLSPARADDDNGDGKNLQAQPWVYDPADTDLVQSTWLSGIGCPTNADVATYPSTKKTSTYPDPACPTGDSKDKDNEGLLLAKTGPTSNNAAAGASIKGWKKNTTVTELGYDLRKPTSYTDARGSHCGAGGPRFNITTNAGSYFLGCASPPPVQANVGNGWIRLRWGTTAPLQAYSTSTGQLTTITTQQVQSIDIVFDEGQDAGPDNFGLAVIDNIDVNGVLIGQGGGKKDK